MIAPTSRGRVLIIDDDRLVAAMLSAHVRAAGFDSRVTSEAAEFFEIEREWEPDFVIVDLVMDQVDGLAVLKHLAEVKSRAAVVVASGMGTKILDAARQFAGANGLSYGGVLAKPFRRADVAAVLDVSVKHPDSPANEQVDVLASWDAERFEMELKEAVAQGHLGVVYQPKVSCLDGLVMGFEALVRWYHPVHGLIVPTSFIPRAESVGLVHLITDTVAEQALTWFASHRRDTREHLSINISASELTESDLDRRLVALCRDLRLYTERVVLEVTETSAVQDEMVGLEVLTRLRLDGFQLSIDDFGTGYSSMTQLSNMPFSEVKIDRSFVRNLGSSLPADVMVRSMLQLSRGLGLECTAEGVETAAALRVLAELGCEYAQGYFIAKPMPAAQLEEWLEGRSAA